MSMVIHKWTLEPYPGSQAVDMQQNAEIVHVREQGARIAIWARVNTDDMPVRRKFIICETGKEVSAGQYVGMAMFDLPFGPYVLHVFDE